MSIRKVGKSILTYFEELFVFTLIAMFLYMHLQLSYSVSTSGHGSFFDLNLFLEGFFYLFPDMAIFTSLCSIFYIIRHKQTFIEAFFGYFLICIFVWLVIVPLWLIKFPLYGDIVLFREYDDPVISQIIDIPSVFKFLADRGQVLHRAGLTLAQKGYGSVLLILPFGVAVSCLAGLSNLSSWRFVNLLNIVFLFIIIFVSNSYLFDTRFVEANALISRLGYWTPFILNSFLSFIFITIEIISLVSRRETHDAEVDL